MMQTVCGVHCAAFSTSLKVPAAHVWQMGNPRESTSATNWPGPQVLAVVQTRSLVGEGGELSTWPSAHSRWGVQVAALTEPLKVPAGQGEHETLLVAVA